MQTLTQRYKHLRRRGMNAAAALAKARELQSDVWHRAGEVNRAFPEDKVQGYRYVNTTYRWIENVSKLNWRLVGFADEIVSLRHKGWFADEFQDSIYRGIVYRLPHGRFVYGYADPNNDDCALIENTFATDEKDAARWADSVAEHFAEREREYSEANNAAYRAIEKANEARNDVREALEDVRQLETCDSPRIQKRVRATFSGLWEQYRDAMAALVDALECAKRYQISYSDF
jgi:hypothetical protein